MSRHTQRLSLVELIESGGRARSHKAIMRVLYEHGAQTDLCLSRLSGVSRSGVCGRISELTEIGYIEERNPVRCATTGKLVRTNKLTKKGYFATNDFIKKEAALEGCTMMTATKKPDHPVSVKVAADAPSGLMTRFLKSGLI